MGLYAPGSFSGRYEPQGDPGAADCVLVCEFGVGKNDTPGAVNEALVDFSLREFGDLPMIMTARLRGFAEQCDPSCLVAETVTGESSNAIGQGVGTSGELRVAKAFMEHNYLANLAVVGQAFHIGRTARQAGRIGLDVIIPPHLPAIFDHDSEQWWTRGPARWALRESLATPMLRHKGQL